MAHAAVREGGVSITQGSDGWVFTKPDGHHVIGGSVMRTWPGTSTSRYAAANRRSMINWLRLTASSTQPRKRSGPAGPVNVSTCMPALKLS
jgi:hypothetical protein